MCARAKKHFRASLLNIFEVLHRPKIIFCEKYSLIMMDVKVWRKSPPDHRKQSSQRWRRTGHITRRGATLTQRCAPSCDVTRLEKATCCCHNEALTGDLTAAHWTIMGCFVCRCTQTGIGASALVVNLVCLSRGGGGRLRMRTFTSIIVSISELCQTAANSVN